METGFEQPTRASDLIAAGNSALARGAWQEARELFEEGLELEETPEGLEGLGRACWWLDDAESVGEVRERAYRAYRERGDAHGAARVALALAEDALVFRAEEAVWSGWTERARRLLADLDPSPEHALLATRDALFTFLLGGDVEAARLHAEKAIGVARRVGTFDLEMVALAIEGAALVAEGKISDGMRLLDEATAAATSGEMHDIELIGVTCCWMIFGCERVGDFPRAAQWCERVGDFCQRHGLISLLGICRTNYAMVLTAAGDWTRAEAELLGAAEDLAARPGQAVDGVARLGELRRLQGRHEESVKLLDEVAFVPEAQIGLAALAIDRGEFEEAANWAERLLRQVPASDRTLRARGHELLARARAANGDLELAHAALADLESVAQEVGSELLRASAAFTRGAVELAAGDTDLARSSLEDAVDRYQRSRLPYEEAEARLLLAEALTASGQDGRAGTERSRAVEAFSHLGAEYAVKRASATLARSGVVGTTLTKRETEILRLVAEGLGDRAIAERLTISEHTVHRHMSNILSKLGATTRAAAAAYAARHELL